MSAHSYLLYILQLAQLRAGLRRGALLSGKAAEVDEAQAVFTQAGFPVLRLAARDAAAAGLSGREEWLFIGQTQEQAEHTRELYLTQRRCFDSGQPYEADTRALGEQLGYPSCCVDSFLSLPRLGDDYLLRAAWYRTVGPVDPRCMFLGRYAPTLLQHAPCSLNCPASIRIADATARELAHLAPDYLTRTEALNRAPLLLLDAARYFRLAGAQPTAQGFGCTGFAGLEGERERLNPLWRTQLEGIRELREDAEGYYFAVDLRGEQRPLTDPESPLRPLMILPGQPTPFSRPVSAVLVESFPDESAQALSSFFPALYVADLHENGITAGLWQLHRSPQDADADAAVLDNFRRTLHAHRPGALFWFRRFDAGAVAIARQVAPGLPQILVDTVSPDRPEGLTHLLPIVDRRRFVDTVLGLARRSPPLWLREIRAGCACGPQPAPPPAGGLLVDPRHPYSPVVTATRLNPRVRGERALLEIAARPGCPYQRPCDQNPLFAGLDLSGLPYRKGCSYCATRTPHYSPIEAGRIVESWLFQLRRARELSRRFDTVRILDQGVAGLLAVLMEALDGLGLPPLTWCVDLRVSELLGQQKALADALFRAQKTGMGLDLFCIGFENFSDAELARFNKGSDARDNHQAVAVIDDLARRFPDSLRRHSAASGFILFTPWTTAADLACNAEAMEALRFERFRSGAFRTRLRLYRDTPLYELARADGLLADAWPDPAWEAGGLYSPEAAWRFADARTARIFALLSDPELQEGEKEGTLLRAAIDIAGEVADLEQARARLRAAAASQRESGQTTPDREPVPEAGMPTPTGQSLEAALVRRRLHPGDFAACMELAREYVAANRPREALREFMAARKLNPAHPDPLLRIGELLARTGQSDKARRLLRQSLEQLGDPKARALVAELLTRLGERDSG